MYFGKAKYLMEVMEAKESRSMKVSEGFETSNQCIEQFKISSLSKAARSRCMGNNPIKHHDKGNNPDRKDVSVQINNHGHLSRPNKMNR